MQPIFDITRRWATGLRNAEKFNKKGFTPTEQPKTESTRKIEQEHLAKYGCLPLP